MTFQTLRQRAGFTLCAAALCVTASSAALAGPDAGDAATEESPSSWSFDGSAGIPKIEGDSFGFVGDLAVGYRAPTWGLSGALGVSQYALAGRDVISANTKTDFKLTYWQQGSVSHGGWAWASRFELDSGSFTSIYSATSPGAAEPQTESSSLTRLTGLFGIRAQPSATFRWAIYGGVGLQNEIYSQSGQGSGDGFSAETSARLTGRFEGWYSLGPGFSATLRSELHRYEVRRLAFFFEGDLSNPASVQTVTGLDSINRLTGQFDGLLLLGMQPNLFIGLDLISVSGDAGSTTVTVPSIGVGLSG